MPLAKSETDIHTRDKSLRPILLIGVWWRIYVSVMKCKDHVYGKWKYEVLKSTWQSFEKWEQNKKA